MLDGRLSRSYLVQTLNYVGHVYPWLTIGCHLVEHVVAEQLKHVPVTGLAPVATRKHSKHTLERIWSTSRQNMSGRGELLSFQHNVHFGDQAEQAAILELFG